MKIFIYCVILIAMLANGADATPFIWVDTEDGDDSSTNYLQPNNPVRTYARALELGAGLEGVGIKIKHQNNRRPNREEARSLMIQKKDISHQIVERELVPGHGRRPISVVNESPTAGFRVTETIIWEIITDENGEQFERSTGIETVVEPI